MKNEAWVLYCRGAITFFFLSVAVVSSWAGGQNGDGDFAQGQAFYKAQNYNAARLAFEKALIRYPRNWQVQLYLGHCYLVLGRNALAKQAYETCLSLTENPQAVRACQGGLERLAPKGAPSKVEVDKKAEGKEEGSQKDEASGKEEPPKLSLQEERIARQKEEVIKEAEREVKRLREEGKEILEQEKNIHGERWQDSQTGEKFFDISQERKQQLAQELEQRCRKVMDEAERKAQLIH
jgi:tetratricopeptide (TPR) repeat protein